MSPQIYLDYNASAPVRPLVQDVVHSALAQTGNPSSIHAAGRKAYQGLSQARQKVANFVGGTPDQVVFTSGGTEANILAIKGIIDRPKKPKISHIFVGATEHPCVLSAVEKTGVSFDIIPVDQGGVIDLVKLETLLSSHEKDDVLICVMMANNETGTIQPVDQIAHIAEKYKAFVHVDAVQAAGKIDLMSLGFGLCAMGSEVYGIVSLALSAHKMGGPQGVGAVVLKDGHTLSAQFTGGGQEQGRRSGTENLPGITGFGVAAELAHQEKDFEYNRLSELRDMFERDVEFAIPSIVFFSKETIRLPNTSCFALPGLTAEKALINLDLDGVCISSGSACSSGKVSQSHVLRAMGVSDDIASCALRLSMGWNTTQKDIEQTIDALRKIASRQHIISDKKVMASEGI